VRFFQPITGLYFTRYIKPRNFAKRQRKLLQWLTPPNSSWEEAYVGCNKSLDGFPCCGRTGPSRTNATLARCRTPETLHRNFAAPEGRRFQLWPNRDGPLVYRFNAPRRERQRIAGEQGEWGGRRLRYTGGCALTASRKNRSPVPAAFSLVR